MLLKTLADGGYIHGNCMTVTGKTMRDNLKNVKFNTKQKVMRNIIIRYHLMVSSWYERKFST